MTIKPILKVCSVAIFFLLVFAALGPSKWVLRSDLGWRIDHFVGYFAITLMFCFAWRRPFLIGGALVAIAVLFEGLQAFTPDRHADFYAASISAGGAMTAILPADFLIRAPRRTTGRALVRLARMRLSAIAGIGRTDQPPIAIGPIRTAFGSVGAPSLRLSSNARRG